MSVVTKILSLGIAAAFWGMGLSSPSVAQETPRLTVMGYNVENFFDAVDDPRMPNADSAEVINSAEWAAAKGAAVARVIERFDFGKGPDVLILSEVESQSALNAILAGLNDKGAAYQTAILIDADPNRPDPKPDRRGIKVAVLSKLPLLAGSSPRAIPVDLTHEPACISRDGQPGTTRDLIEVDLALPDGQSLTVFGGHLPSGGNPLMCRVIAVKTLADAAAKLPTARIVIAAGDFNFNCAATERTGLHAALKDWIMPAALENACRGGGSQFYRKEKTWSYLDVIAQKPTSGKLSWAIDTRTFRTVLTDTEQVQWDERDEVLRPKAFRFDASSGKGSGTSDHWPIAIDLVRTQ